MMNLSGYSDRRYKFTSRELDPDTSLRHPGATYDPDRRLFGRDPSDDSWRVEDRALRARQWLSVDPLAKKYPGWSVRNPKWPPGLT